MIFFRSVIVICVCAHHAVKGIFIFLRRPFNVIEAEHADMMKSIWLHSFHTPSIYLNEGFVHPSMIMNMNESLGSDLCMLLCDFCAFSSSLWLSFDERTEKKLPVGDFTTPFHNPSIFIACLHRSIDLSLRLRRSKTSKKKSFTVKKKDDGKSNGIVLSEANKPFRLNKLKAKLDSIYLYQLRFCVEKEIEWLFNIWQSTQKFRVKILLNYFFLVFLSEHDNLED